MAALDMWKAVLGKPSPAAVKMIDALMGDDVADLSRTELAAAIGVSTHTNGYFYGGIKHLKDAGVVVEEGGRISLASPLPGEMT